MRVRKANQKNYSHVVDWKEGGERRRRFFDSFKAAQLFARKKSDVLDMVPRGEKPVEPDEFRAVIEARVHEVPLMEAVMHWRRTAGASAGRLMADLIAARLKASDEDELSVRHRNNVTRILTVACEMMGGMPAASVTAEDCQEFIELWKGHASQKQGRAVLGSVFSHAMGRGWLQFNPASTLKMKRPKLSAETEVFAVEDAAQWLCCVAAHAPACLAGWAIAMFAGLRRAEVERLEWSEVRLERGHILVTKGKSKTRTRRLVDIMPNLALILEPLVQESGKVFPHSPKRSEAWAFAAYGRLPAKNVARHSFVSYHLALFSDLSGTEMQAGHGRDILFQHYRELVTKGDAEAYFSIVV